MATKGNVFQRKWVKVLCVILSVIAVLVIAAIGAIQIAYKHRSDPSGRKYYETDNPFIADGRSMISAHRAGAGIAPEETMMAFSKSIGDQSYGVDLFEFDLHITKDGVLVLLHDDILDRVSDCEKVFGETNCHPEDYTFDELVNDEEPKKKNNDEQISMFNYQEVLDEEGHFLKRYVSHYKKLSHEEES